MQIIRLILSSFMFAAATQLYGMDPEIQKLIDRAYERKRMAQELLECFPDQRHEWKDMLYPNGKEEVAAIICNAGSRMSSIEKLKNLSWYCGAEQWKAKKEIIQHMIMVEHSGPDSIQYGGTTAMLESVGYYDTDFTAYLETHGATSMPDKEKTEFYTYLEASQGTY